MANAERDQRAYQRNCKIRTWLLEPLPSLRGEELRVYLEYLISWASRRMSMAYEIDNLIEERLEINSQP